MKASTGASIVMLRQQNAELRKKLHAAEMVGEAALAVHQKSMDMAAEILQKFAQQGVVKPRFANWYWTMIKRGVRVDELRGSMSPDEEAELQEFMAMFTQQHYEALANVLRETRIKLSAGHNSATVEQIHDKLTGVAEFQLALQALLKRDNPKFKELLFIGAASEHAPTPKAKR